MSIKAYKLVPIRDFEKSNLNKDGGETKKMRLEKKDEVTESADAPIKRSINDIIHNNTLENTMLNI